MADRKRENWAVDREQQDGMLEIFEELKKRDVDLRTEDEKCRTLLRIAGRSF